ncbi:BlaI/MecI/CopY family transcriptional regulator [Nocardioides marmoriginsengisoli]|uniref:BlaI/MecI/CopY family transcriptional regulator n=1 Tax=Nocardioides marmoriginsengisoli TaxID=661483 RepID=A0A3N0CNL2_9ACTN|nr:BlaI/MecI/CopY family transcriptional regulator [Nocardioides marmoriginsengisoli]RNL64891.1 BlaI/MecI/CopY family transcriptional regulator [Nocardioides marmoriginsengisoli]
MKQLGQLEARVMQRLWESGRPLAVRDVLEDLQRERDIAYTTVMTVMDHLHRKNLVRREKVGRAYLYSATTTREAHTASLLEQVLADSSNPSGTLMHFVGQLSPDELAALRSALDEAGGG